MFKQRLRPARYLLLVFLSLDGVLPTPSHGLVDDRRITIYSATELKAKRQALIRFLWGTAGFPSNKLPASVQQGVPSPVRDLGNLERVDTFHISMDAGQTNVTHHFIPRSKNNRLVILHHGHACTFDDGPGSGNHDWHAENYQRPPEQGVRCTGYLHAPYETKRLWRVS